MVLPIRVHINPRDIVRKHVFSFKIKIVVSFLTVPPEISETTVARRDYFVDKTLFTFFFFFRFGVPISISFCKQ